MREKGANAWKLWLDKLAAQRLDRTKLSQKGKKKEKEKKQLFKEPPALKRPFSELRRHKEKGGRPISPRPRRPPPILLSAALSPPIPLSVAPVLSFYSFFSPILLITASPGRHRRSFLRLPEGSETLLDSERGEKKQRKICKKTKRIKRNVRVWFLVQR